MPEADLIFDAVKQGDAVRVRELLAADPSCVNRRGSMGQTLLRLAADEGHRGIADLLIAAGADIHAGRKGCTTLHDAVAGGSREVAELLLDKGAAVNATDEDGATPLHLLEHVSGNRGVGIADLLIARGADTNARNHSGATPLHQVMNGRRNEGVIELLIKRGADVHAVDGEGKTPLILASYS